MDQKGQNLSDLRVTVYRTKSSLLNNSHQSQDGATMGIHNSLPQQTDYTHTCTSLFNGMIMPCQIILILSWHLVCTCISMKSKDNKLINLISSRQTDLLSYILKKILQVALWLFDLKYSYKTTSALVQIFSSSPYK